MSHWNLALRPAEERQAMEDEKARLFEFWQQNLDRAKAEAAKILAEKDRRKSKWKDWAREQVAALSPPEYQAMVRQQVER